MGFVGITGGLLVISLLAFGVLVSLELVRFRWDRFRKAFASLLVNRVLFRKIKLEAFVVGELVINRNLGNIYLAIPTFYVLVLSAYATKTSIGQNIPISAPKSTSQSQAVYLHSHPPPFNFPKPS